MEKCRDEKAEMGTWNEWRDVGDGFGLARLGSKGTEGADIECWCRCSRSCPTRDCGTRWGEKEARIQGGGDMRLLSSLGLSESRLAGVNGCVVLKYSSRVIGPGGVTGDVGGHRSCQSPCRSSVPCMGRVMPLLLSLLLGTEEYATESEQDSRVWGAGSEHRVEDMSRNVRDGPRLRARGRLGLRSGIGGWGFVGPEEEGVWGWGTFAGGVTGRRAGWMSMRSSNGANALLRNCGCSDENGTGDGCVGALRRTLKGGVTGISPSADSTLGILAGAVGSSDVIEEVVRSGRDLLGV